MSIQTYNHQIFTTDNLAHSYSFIEEQEKVVKLDNKFLDTIIAIDMTEENCTVSTTGNGKTTYYSLRLSEDVANLFKDEKRNTVILNNYYCLHRSVKHPTSTSGKFFGIFYDTQWKGQITCYHLRIEGTLAELMTEVLPISMLDNDANFINEESVDAKINAINTTKDWNENDVNVATYIQNRTHYVEDITKSDTPIYSNTNIEDSSWELSDNNVYVLTDSVSVSNNEIGQGLYVSINGVEQYLEIQQSGRYYYVGNPALSSAIPSDIDTGEDYIIILWEAK